MNNIINLKKTIYVYHKDWENQILIENNSLTRLDSNGISMSTCTDFFINEHFLKINWNGIINYFLSYDEINYYEYTEKYYSIFFKNYSYYYTLINNENSEKCILYLANHKLNICYNLHNIELYYFFHIHKNHFVLYDELTEINTTFIYFLNKYYELNYFNKNYFSVELVDFIFNKITLHKSSNLFYYDLNVQGTYKKFGTYLILTYFGHTYLFQQIHKIDCMFHENVNICSYKFIQCIDNIDNTTNINNCIYINDSFYDFDYGIGLHECVNYTGKNIIVCLFDAIENNELLNYFIEHHFYVFIFCNILHKNTNNIYHNLNVNTKIIYYNVQTIDLLLEKISHLSKLYNVSYYLSNVHFEMDLNFGKTNEFSINLLNNNYHIIEHFNKLTDLFELNSKLNNDIFDTFFEIHEKFNWNLNSNWNYNSNFIKNSKIPKILHFIWLGNNQYPDYYYLFLNSWIIKYPDFIFCFWNDSNLISLYNQSVFDKSETYAQKSDIARYEILYMFGGIYVDCDFYSVTNIESLLSNIDCFSGYESDEFIAIGIMGFKRKNSHLKHLILNLELNYYLNINNKIPDQTGPVYFTNFWKHYVINNIEKCVKKEKYKFFDKQIFYNYSYQDKYNNKPIVFNKNNYCYHSWGYSWDVNKVHQPFLSYYLLNFIFNGSIEPFNEVNEVNDCHEWNHKNEMNIMDLSRHYQKQVFFKPLLRNCEVKKPLIIHVMGYFFTGGIERFMLNLDLYGNHNKYDYILLFLKNENECYYEYLYEKNDDNKILKKKQKKLMKHMKYYYFKNHQELLHYLSIFNPDLIIDHYSQYFSKSIYKNNIYQHITIHLIHSAIHYDTNIDFLNIINCIHLYDEENKHESWKKIKNNYINSLGVQLIDKSKLHSIWEKKKVDIENNKKLVIGIVGRIVEEKIPLCFLEKLVNMMMKIKQNKGIKKNMIGTNFKIQIYGSLGDDSKYNELFNEYIKDLDGFIEYMGQVNFCDIHNIYENIDYLLIPSVFETGSYVCLEALSYGIPVIARNNYGLRKIIKNGISGHLCDGDDELIHKIKYLYYDNLVNNHSIIYKESLKYNVIDKMNTFESILDKHISSKNLVIVSSVLNIIDDELSYYHMRSMFSLKERFNQTLKTIQSIREKIPDSFILFIECSDLNNCICECESECECNIEKSIIENVDVYINCYIDLEIRKGVNSKYKGWGENLLIMKAIEYVNNCENLVFNNVFKISGRYYLNEYFDYSCFTNSNNQFVLWDANFSSYASLFYKIKFKYLGLFYLCLVEINHLLENGECLEIVVNKHFNEKMNYKNISILDKMNISGYLSTEGYFFSI